MLRWTLLLLALAPCLASAWSQATRELALRAQAEYPGRIVVVESLADTAARRLPVEARAQLAQAQREVFPRAPSRGVVTPFRWHWLDTVRCAILVPPDPDPEVELLALAHELGHCVARLDGWHDTLWHEPDLARRHRAESWADAFAVAALPPSLRARAAALSADRRALHVADAAYLTERGIGCGLAVDTAAGSPLREIGRRVEARFQAAGCLMEEPRLRATQSFLLSVGSAPVAAAR